MVHSPIHGADLLPMAGAPCVASASRLPCKILRHLLVVTPPLVQIAFQIEQVAPTLHHNPFTFIMLMHIVRLAQACQSLRRVAHSRAAPYAGAGGRPPTRQRRRPPPGGKGSGCPHRAWWRTGTLHTIAPPSSGGRACGAPSRMSARRALKSRGYRPGAGRGGAVRSPGTALLACSEIRRRRCS